MKPKQTIYVKQAGPFSPVLCAGCTFWLRFIGGGSPRNGEMLEKRAKPEQLQLRRIAAPACTRQPCSHSYGRGVQGTVLFSSRSTFGTSAGSRWLHTDSCLHLENHRTAQLCRRTGTGTECTAGKPAIRPPCTGLGSKDSQFSSKLWSHSIPNNGGRSFPAPLFFFFFPDKIERKSTALSLVWVYSERHILRFPLEKEVGFSPRGHSSAGDLVTGQSNAE